MTTKNKTIYCAVLAAVTLGLSFGAYHLGVTVNIHSRANALMNNSLTDLNNEYNNANSKKEMLEKQKKELNSQIKDKSSVNKDIEKSMKEIDAMNDDIDAAKEKINELDKQIDDKNKELDDTEKILSSASGKTFNAGVGTYTCPENIAPGRYVISGDYKLLIYSESGSPKISEDLSRIETKSFVFTISDGEKIRLER